MRPLALVALLTGCGFAVPGSGSTDANPSDVRTTDAPPPDAACRSTCADQATLLDCASGALQVCPLGCKTAAASGGGDRCGYPTPSNGASQMDVLGVTGDLIIAADAVLDTDSGAVVAGAIVLRSPGTGLSPEGLRATALDTDRMVIGARFFTIQAGATLRVHGTRTLIVIARADITIEGVLDGSAGILPCGSTPITRCGGPGGGVGGAAGAAGGGCSAGGGGFAGSGDETGGGGGGYGLPKGGDGGQAANAGGIGGGGGCSTQEVVPLVGGSGGGGGGQGGAGGGGGGAMQLTAFGNLLVRTSSSARATVKANGAGGVHGSSGSGGGGGGSAGALLLEGQRVVIDNGTLAANAGSGGAGDGGNDGGPGSETVAPTAGGTGGRAGGAGAARTGSPQAGAGGGDGTGGGGGGIGRIYINAGTAGYVLMNGAVVSPIEYNGIPPAF